MESVPKSSTIHQWSERDFSLTPEEVKRIRRSKKSKGSTQNATETFSFSLSPEGKLAMLQAKEETVVEHAPRKAVNGNGRGRKSTVKDNGFAQGESSHTKSKLHLPLIKTMSFTDAYEKLNSLRFKDDITEDMSSTQSDPSKRSIGGGKLGNAMEIVETVVSGADSWATSNDEVAIEETAKLNSVEKCLAWFEVQQKALQGYEYVLSE